jgi:hypothetical protein
MASADHNDHSAGGSPRSVVALSDLDDALALLVQAEQTKAQAAVLLGRVADADLARWLGYVSTERLVAHRTGSGNDTARSFVRVARHLERFPATAAALIDGRVTWAVVEVLAAAAAGRADAYAESEEELLDVVEGAEPAEAERICRLWRAQVDAESTLDESERIHRRRGVWMQQALDGSCDGRFRLDAIGADAVWAALDSAPDPEHTLPEPRTCAQRRADKLVNLCEQSLGRGPSTLEPIEADEADECCGHGGQGRAAVNVVIDLQTLAGNDAPLDEIRSELDNGGPLTGPGLDRVLCDASFRALITDGPRAVLAYNRATPAIPPALRRAVRIRDRSCTFPGCDRPWNWCDLHHIIPRNRGGPTTADNLTLLCRFHHTTVHEGGWQLTRGPNGAIEVTSP